MWVAWLERNAPPSRLSVEPGSNSSSNPLANKERPGATLTEPVKGNAALSRISRLAVRALSCPVAGSVPVVDVAWRLDDQQAAALGLDAAAVKHLGNHQPVTADAIGAHGYRGAAEFAALEDDVVGLIGVPRQGHVQDAIRVVRADRAHVGDRAVDVKRTIVGQQLRIAQELDPSGDCAEANQRIVIGAPRVPGPVMVPPMRRLGSAGLPPPNRIKSLASVVLTEPSRSTRAFQPELPLTLTVPRTLTSDPWMPLPINGSPLALMLTTAGALMVHSSFGSVRLTIRLAKPFSTRVSVPFSCN